MRSSVLLKVTFLGITNGIPSAPSSERRTKKKQKKKQYEMRPVVRPWFGALSSMKYPVIAITPWSTLTWIGCTF